MKKVCAYCGGPPPFTREHIWPNGFLKRGEFGIKFSARANKTFKGDLVIADVCAACNNGPLSVLDSHACELYDRRFEKRVEAASIVTFTYDYGLLMRWLLKISYNSARASGREAINSGTEILARYRETILCGSPCSPVWVVAYIATIAPSTLTDSTTGGLRKLYPDAARCGPIRLDGIDVSDLAVLRCVMIKGYYFTLLITCSTGVKTQRMLPVIRNIPGQPLDPSGRMRIGPPSIPAQAALDGTQHWPELPAQLK